MKVYCYTTRPSLDLVCSVNGCKTLFPDNWPGGAPRQDECTSIEQVKQFITETNAKKVMFGFRDNGIPVRAVSVDDPKVDKALKKIARY